MKIYDVLTESEKRVGLFEMRVRLNNVPQGEELPQGAVIFGYADSIWVITGSSWKANKEDIAADIRQKMGLEDDELKVTWMWSPEALMDFADTRSDVVAFEKYEDKLLYRRHTYGQSPQTSPLFKKVASYIKQTFGLDPRPFAMGVQMTTGGSADVDPSTFRGELPREGWHGTRIEAVASMLSKGIVPQQSGNYNDVHTPGYIFFAADKSSLVHKYAMHSSGGLWTMNTIPVIVHFKVPDQNRIKPDVDVAHNLYGKNAAKANPDYKHLPFKDKEEGQPDSTKGKKNPERMWKHSEVFGYKGRIPPSYIMGFITYEKFGGEDTSAEQMIENIKAWNALKTKFEPKAILQSNVSWVGKNANQIVNDVSEELQPDQPKQ
jgi:hypothetical protein